MEFRKIMTNPSTIWAMLALPNPPVGSIPFVAPDSTTIVTDVVNFFYSQAGLSLYPGSIAPLQLTIFGGLRTGYSDLSGTPATAVTINKPAGRVALPIGQASIIVTDNYCFASSLVRLQVEGMAFDATATKFQVTPGNGSFTIVANANATATVVLNFDIINVF